jgi:hypothetical protein
MGLTDSRQIGYVKKRISVLKVNKVEDCYFPSQKSIFLEDGCGRVFII